MKKLISSLLVASAMTFSAVAAAETFYISGQLGFAKQKLGESVYAHQGNNTWKNVTSTLENSLAGRLAGGYEINENVAVELGLAGYHSGKVEFVDNGKTVADLKQRSLVLDLLVKGTLPISEDFSLFAKAGPAYVMTQFRLAATEPDDREEAKSKTFAPKLAVGGAYNFNDNLALDLTLSHIIGKGKITDVDKINEKNSKFRPAITSLMLGLTYKF